MRTVEQRVASAGPSASRYIIKRAAGGYELYRERTLSGVTQPASRCYWRTLPDLVAAHALAFKFIDAGRQADGTVEPASLSIDMRGAASIG